MAGKGDLYYIQFTSIMASLLAMYNSRVKLDFGCGHRPALGMGGSEGGEGGWLCSRRAFFFVVDTRRRHTHSKPLNQAKQTIQ